VAGGGRRADAAEVGAKLTRQQWVADWELQVMLLPAFGDTGNSFRELGRDRQFIFERMLQKSPNAT
jgi:hypothetical protein